MSVGIFINAFLAMFFALLTWASVRFGATEKAMKSIPNAKKFFLFGLFVLAPITLCFANVFLLISELK
jgi:hypothetical protein